VIPGDHDHLKQIDDDYKRYVGLAEERGDYVVKFYHHTEWYAKLYEYDHSTLVSLR
jgi:hypothetical protein